MEVNKEVVSVLYNLQAGRTVYNIQSGFRDDFDKKLSLGTLHMGYSIEDCFEDSRILNFDMLAGAGKSEFYKNRYKGQVVEFVTLRITSNKRLKLLYMINRVFPEKLKAKLSTLLNYFKR